MLIYPRGYILRQKMSENLTGKERARRYILGFFESAQEECPRGMNFMVFLDKKTLRLHKALVKGFMNPDEVTNNVNFVYVGIYNKTSSIQQFKHDMVVAWRLKDNNSADDVMSTLEKLGGVQ